MERAVNPEEHVGAMAPATPPCPLGPWPGEDITHSGPVGDAWLARPFQNARRNVLLRVAQGGASLQ